MKKALLWLCVALLLATPVLFASAEEKELSRDPALIAEAEQLYRNCLKAAGRSTFHGRCGLATSYQLWQLGINLELEVHDGNKQFDSYYHRGITDGGYHVEVYDGAIYTLVDALNLISQNGTRPVRNILVGFQWTSTEAGATYGHACVINAIQDGTVYFTESFDYAMGRMEGKAVTCTIEEFGEFFADWTTYEGLIYFGTKQYVDSCQSYPTDLYVQLRFDSSLRSQPCLLGQNDCMRLRSLPAGELLHATGVYINDDGDLFYQIDDGGVTGYVSANAVYRFQRNAPKVSLQNGNVPVSMNLGKAPVLAGQVRVTGGQLTQLRLEVTNQGGEVSRQVLVECTGENGDLAQLNEPLELHTLGAGSYMLTLIADVVSPTVENGVLHMDRASQVLLQQPLCVDCDVPELPVQESSAPEDTTDQNGWFLKDGIWYCYENGKPCTGWATRIGVSYYLQDDGAATTGWRQECGEKRYFSATGALCNGWFTTADGTYYWGADEQLATGLTSIDGIDYYFRENGTLALGSMVTVEGVSYRVGLDGVATPIE